MIFNIIYLSIAKQFVESQGNKVKIFAAGNATAMMGASNANAGNSKASGRQLRCVFCLGVVDDESLIWGIYVPLG